MEPTPIRRLSSGGLSVPPAGVEEESPRRRLFASAAKDIENRGGTSHQQQQNCISCLHAACTGVPAHAAARGVAAGPVLRRRVPQGAVWRREVGERGGFHVKARALASLFDDAGCRARRSRRSRRRR